MAQIYKSRATKVLRPSSALIEHCNQLVATYRSEAESLSALAKEHERMASESS